jgi:hypothetical protein
VRARRYVGTVSSAFAVAAAGLAASRHLTHGWGATPIEHAAPLPGDELVAEPAIVATRAVTIAATPEQIWPWLVQIGQDRGGMYSYDWLENLLGLDIHSTDVIRDEWQDLAVGDRITLMPAGFAGAAAGYSLPVVRIDPPRSLVLRQAPPEHPWDAVWSFHLVPLDDGRTRLISRSRSHRHHGLRGAIDVALDAAMDPVTWLMTRKMLLGIEQRAETGAGPPVHIRRQLDDDIARLGLHDRRTDTRVVTGDDLADLPAPAERYLRRMGVVGMARPHCFRIRFRGEMRLRAGQSWMPLEAWQVNALEPIARVFRMRIDVAGAVPMFGIDRYEDRAGHMDGKLLGLVSVAHGEGREFDLGELVTWVNDAALLAPAMLLGRRIEWKSVDERSFDVVVTDGPNVVSARLVLDDDDRLVDFITDDRWYAGVDPPRRTRWHTPIDGWTTAPDGRLFPGHCTATWQLPEGDLAYVRGTFDPATLTFDLAVDAARRSVTLAD